MQEAQAVPCRQRPLIWRQVRSGIEAGPGRGTPLKLSVPQMAQLFVDLCHWQEHRIIRPPDFKSRGEEVNLAGSRCVEFVNDPENPVNTNGAGGRDLPQEVIPVGRMAFSWQVVVTRAKQSLAERRLCSRLRADTCTISSLGRSRRCQARSLRAFTIPAA